MKVPDVLVYLVAWMFPVHAKPYATPTCDRCGRVPAIQRGLCEACLPKEEEWFV